MTKAEQLAEAIKASRGEKIEIKLSGNLWDDGGSFAAGLGVAMVCFKIVTEFDRILAIAEAAVR